MRDVCDTFATQSALVYDVIDTDGCAQNVSTHGHIFSGIQTSICKEEDQKASGKLLRVSLLLFFNILFLLMLLRFGFSLIL